jgi:hypothetical protein
VPKKNSSGQKPGKTDSTITVAKISGITAIIVAIISIVGIYIQFIEPHRLSTQATQTAEARLALIASSETPSPSTTSNSTSTLTPTSTTTPTSTPTPTSTYMPTPTPMPSPTPNGIRIDGFENGIPDWYAALRDQGPREVATAVSLNTDAADGTGALKCEFDFRLAKAPDPHANCFLVKFPTEDWRDYKFLQFQAKNLADAKYNVEVTFALATGANSCWYEPRDFRPIDSAYHTITFDIDSERYKSCLNKYQAYDQPLRNKDKVVKLNLLFTADGQPSGAVLIDEIWLLKP